MWSALDVSWLLPAPNLDGVHPSPTRRTISLQAATRTASKVDLRVKGIQWVCIVLVIPDVFLIAARLLQLFYSGLVTLCLKFNAVKDTVLWLQVVTSRGKSLVKRVVKEQVCYCHSLSSDAALCLAALAAIVHTSSSQNIFANVLHLRDFFIVELFYNIFQTLV